MKGGSIVGPGLDGACHGQSRDHENSGEVEVSSKIHAIAGPGDAMLFKGWRGIMPSTFFKMKQISISETVMFYDTDCGGVVSNIAYLRFVERARSALFDELGMDIRSMNESQLFPAVVR